MVEFKLVNTTIQWSTVMETTALEILFLGNIDCGKRSYLTRLSGSPPPYNDAAVPYHFTVSFSRKRYDLTCHASSSPTGDWQARRPDLIVLCYDISTRLTLIDAQRSWYPAAVRAFSGTSSSSSPPPLFLLGLKRDLRSETDPNGIIYPQEAHRIAAEMRCDGYAECSARTGELVAESWEDICKAAVKSSRERSAAGGEQIGGCVVL